MADYRRIADRIAEDIASGRLKPGDRLPPQRVFARRRGIAGSTAGRVYTELVRRGLVVGEVGRGTFVRAAPAASVGRALAEQAGSAPVNLELNYRPCGLSSSEPTQPHAPNGLGRTGPRRTQPRGSDTHPVRGPIPGGQFPHDLAIWVQPEATGRP